MRYILGSIILLVVSISAFFFFGHGATVEKWTTVNKERLPVSPLAKRVWEARNQYDVNKNSACAKRFGGVDALIRAAETKDDIGFEAEQCLEQIINGTTPKKTEYRRTVSQTAPQPTLPKEQWKKVGKFQYNPTLGWAALNSNHIGNGTCAIRCDGSIIRVKNTEYIGSTPGFPCDDLHAGRLISVRSIKPQKDSQKVCSIEQLFEN